MEGLISHSGDALSDALLMHALRLLALHLSNVDPVERGELMLAAVLCGQGTDYTGAGITTVLGHAIGARCNLENGTANAIVLPHALRFNAEVAQAGLQKVAASLGLASSKAESPLTLINRTVEGLFRELAIPRRLRDVGVPGEALSGVAAHAMGDWFLSGNPRPVRAASELEQVLVEAW
jgi:alcohol dehydrogenase class IV